MLKMLPPEVMKNAREQVRQAAPGTHNLGRYAALFIVCTWLLLTLLLALFAYRLFF
ncbi:hypothetical protein [Ktedonospora formicarum]|uniref:Uncharacterized protein n=1 Tax=Ktedonospora formicarum TaxID=2778364 RepID=A0A8J3MYS6_9CHLR|nr:hypothetical protein [Ktedonospora formicarum]GHO50000.1 hypothetical protein KSX_81630 [Ktedonospora formicarum]